MTMPRAVEPNRIIFSSRRCTQREFRLRPDAETNNAFIYALAEAAQHTGVQVILPQMMTNHEHDAFVDLLGREVEFRQRFHRNLALIQNARYGLSENMWASGAPSVIVVKDRETLMQKLVYTAINPVKDGLVERVRHWPGPKFLKALLTGEPLRATRPPCFRKNGPMPAEVELRLGLPEGFPDPQGFRTELAARVAAAEEAYARERRATGRRVLGRRAVRKQHWRDRPTTPTPRGKRHRQVSAATPEAQRIAEAEVRAWRAAYRSAYLRMRAGLPAVFPYGTYWLARFANVRVQPPPRPPSGMPPPDNPLCHFN